MAPCVPLSASFGFSFSALSALFLSFAALFYGNDGLQKPSAVSYIDFGLSLFVQLAGPDAPPASLFVGLLAFMDAFLLWPVVDPGAPAAVFRLW